MEHKVGTLLLNIIVLMIGYSRVTNGLTVEVCDMLDEVKVREFTNANYCCTFVSTSQHRSGIYFKFSHHARTAPDGLYNTGEDMQVTLTPYNLGSSMFKTVVIQAFDAGNVSGKPLGQWIQNRTLGIYVKACNKADNNDDTVFQFNGVSSYRFRATNVNASEIVFRSTVEIQDTTSQQFFYFGIQSNTTSHNPCDPENLPCGDGACQVSPTSYTGYICICPDGIERLQCISRQNPCEYQPTPCGDDGVCFQSDSTDYWEYWCVCLDGSNGTQCPNSNPCVPDPCINGDCAEDGQFFTCSCNIGWLKPDYSAVCSIQEFFACDPNPCINGDCTPRAIEDYECSCMDGWIGTNCDVKVYCPENHCENGGTCTGVDTNNNTNCRCLIGYGGNRCEISPCSEDMCSNGGTCYQPDNNVAEYFCNCLIHFRGDNCQEELTQCVQEPCRNGATCVDSSGMFQCLCPDTYAGILCEAAPCEGVECMNGGSCFVEGDKGDAECVCVGGYTGSRCQIDINECLGGPCLNDGTCDDMINSYRCTCQDAFTGDICQINKSNCVNNGPCQNGGECEWSNNGQTGGKCNCPLGWLGSNCETNVNECNSIPCMNGGQCEDLVNGYICECLDDYTGTTCETALESTDGLTIEAWWIALICLIGSLFIVFIIVVLCTMNRNNTNNDKSQMISA